MFSKDRECVHAIFFDIKGTLRHKCARYWVLTIFCDI